MSSPGDRWAEDRKLAEAAAGGDRDAMQALCRRAFPRVLRHLEVLTGDPELARELAQETFLTAATRLQRYRGESSLETWLAGIAFNVARGFLAVRRRRRALRDRLEGTAAPVEGTDAEGHVDMGRARLRLYGALEKIPDPQRQAFVLRVIEDVPLDQASEILGVPVSTVSYRARRAEARLREILGEG